MKATALTVFWGLVIIWLLWGTYLAVIGDPDFICGFKLFFGDRSCLHVLHQ